MYSSVAFPQKKERLNIYFISGFSLFSGEILLFNFELCLLACIIAVFIEDAFMLYLEQKFVIDYTSYLSSSEDVVL